MILYFSGTGNSAYVARYMGKSLEEETIKITDKSPSQIKFSGKRIILVFPIYSWGVPPIMIDYIKNLPSEFLKSASDISTYIICVCGDETALAPEMMINALKSVSLGYKGGWSVQMPNNYVLLPGFNVDSKKVERDKLKSAPSRLDDICNRIRENHAVKDNRIIEDYTRGKNSKIKSKLIYPLFKKWGIIPSRWHFTEECIGCGRCVGVCPVNNIRFSNGRPKWGNDCTSCLACYHICPTHAIHYGKITRNKGQYFFHGK